MAKDPPPPAPTKSKTKAKNITDKSMGESGLLYVCKGQKDSISKKAVLYETAFIHAIPFSTKGQRKNSETGKDGEKKTKNRKRSLIKHPYPGVKS